jgi:TRAP-type transport system periplasmic protein
MKGMIAKSVLALTVSTGLTSLAAAETLRWGEHLPQCCSMYTAALEWMVDEVAERSDGELTIEVNWGGVLATVGEIPTAIENRIIDTGNLVTPYFPDQFVINNAIPFFWPQPKSQGELGELMLKWHDEFPAFGEELARYNARLVSVRPLPPYGMICSTPIRSMEEFRGKRVRSYGVALPAMLEALGAVPVGQAEVEAYEAMANNVIDCSVADIALVDAFQLEEVGDYFIDVPMGASWGHILLMNIDRYNELSEEHQAIIDGIKHDHLIEMLRLFREREEVIKAEWEADGSVEIITIPADEFLDVTLNDPGVQAVRDSWAERAMAAGLPEEHAMQVVADINE